jgi:hypothetical protein
VNPLSATETDLIPCEFNQRRHPFEGTIAGNKLMSSTDSAAHASTATAGDGSKEAEFHGFSNAALT